MLNLACQLIKIPTEDLKIFLEVLNELQSAAEQVVNDKDWVKFFFENNEDIGAVLTFVQTIPSRSNKKSLIKYGL